MKILIAGGSGLVGSNLTRMLVDQGHEVRLLSRKKHPNDLASVFTWDIQEKTIEEGALDGVDAVVNLAGSGIADRRWSSQVKEELFSSRIESVKCLFINIKNRDQKPAVMVTASGKDYYGILPFDTESSETDSAGGSFLGRLCSDWENEAGRFEELGIRTAQLRIGLVLDKDKGALAKLAQPIQLGLGAPLGSGKQVMPWIHLDDICRLVIHVLNTGSASGPFNTVGHNAVTNEEFNKILAKVLKKPLWLPNVPAFVLKLLLGEMADLVLTGNYVRNKKILDTGFKFKFEYLEEALKEIYRVD